MPNHITYSGLLSIAAWFYSTIFCHDVNSSLVKPIDYPVRGDQIVSHPDQFLIAWLEIVNVLAVLFHWASVPVLPLVERIREVYTALGVGPQIVGAVEFLALVVFDQHRCFARHINRPQFVVEVCASEEVALLVEVKTVRSAGLVVED